MKVVLKVEASPADVIRAFGQGVTSYRNGNYSTREFDFTDSNMDKFLIYDWKSSQNYGGPPIPGWDYENQNFIRPMHRKKIYPTEAEFWNSDEAHEFRINCTELAEVRKFREWFLREVIFFGDIKIDSKS